MARAKAAENPTPAVAYFRTSSAANVGPDKDSLARQRAAVAAYAKARGLEVVREFRDEAVSVADPIDRRPGFVEMLGYLHADGDGARVILVETANRFARDLAVQLTGHDLLKARGIELVPVDAPDHFADDIEHPPPQRRDGLCGHGSLLWIGLPKPGDPDRRRTVVYDLQW